jgi:multidrug transporter EmrE-like cation transporter
MEKYIIIILVVVAVGVAVLANSISAVWASQESKIYTWWLPAVILISPLVFITFGLTVEKLGVTVGSATLDSSLTIATVLVGLIFFGEWASTSSIQYLGLVFTLSGIVLMHMGK